MLSGWHKQQREHYEVWAKDYGRIYEQNNPYFDFVLAHFLGAVRPRPGLKVLEIGASGGRFTLPMLAAGCQVTAVDLSRAVLDYLQKSVEDPAQRAALRLAEDDASTLQSIADRDYDVVAGGHILHHVEQLPAVIAQAASRLKPGGRAVFVEPNPWSFQQYVANTFLPGLSWSVEKGLLRMWPGRIRRLFLESGFKECRVAPFGVFPPFFLKRLNVGGWVDGFERRAESLGRPSGLFTLNLFVGEA